MDRDEPAEPSFAPLDDGRGIEVVDPIERRRFALYGPSPADRDAGSDDAFGVPVDTAATFPTDRIRLDEVVEVVVRDGSREMVAQVQSSTTTELPPDEYLLEVNGPIKVYLRLESGLSIASDEEELSIEFPGTRRIHVGARSYHSRPAATITTTGDPESIARAISTLGSALKTTSPERAYPTLRGHPPAIELGDEFRMPPGLSTPDTGVTIEVTEDYASLFAIAPLAYYLAADVKLGDRPRIEGTDGFVHPLGESEDGVEREVERVVKQTFLLDCVTRTEGFYRIPLGERAALEPAVDLDFERLYDQPLARRLEAYLDVPYESIEPHVPTWNLIAHVPPSVEYVDVLPYVIDNLAIVRSVDASALSPANVRDAVLTEYFEGKTDSTRTGGGDGEPEEERIVQIAETDAMEDAWFGEAAPLNATKAHAAAYRHRFDPSSRGWPIDIAVVHNGAEMADEHATAEAVYGSHHALPFEVTLHRDLSVSELADVFADEVDFLHYIGHTTADGFRCRDGTLDAASLDTVGVETFFLNSCRSYRQGVRLIEAGSVGGVVTLSDVNDRGAATVGRTVARLLNRGFPMRAALQLASYTSVVGGHYIAVGDGTADLISPEGSVPLVCRVESLDGGQYEASIQVFLPREGGMGTTVFPLLESNDRHRLAPGVVATFRVSPDELREYLRWHPVPVVFEDELILEDHVDAIGL